MKINTVSEISNLVKKNLNLQFPGFTTQGVVKDIFNSGSFLIFSLTDKYSKVKCILRFVDTKEMVFDDGDMVEVRGSLSVFERSSEFQIIVSAVNVCKKNKPTRKKELFADDSEKVFELRKKQDVVDFPKLITTVGIITSLDGAALSDILTVVNDELRYLRVKIFPAIMGGRRVLRSLETVTNAINSDKDLDVVIMTRGGGSYEDLAVFNSKNIAHLLKEIRVPVISAIGHAKDEVLADTASCFSVSTPTAAIQKIVTNKIKFERKLEHLWSELHVAFLRSMNKNHVQLKKIDTKLYGTRNIVLDKEFRLRLIFQKVFLVQRNLIAKCLKITSDNKRRLDLARKKSVKIENISCNNLTFEKKIEKSRQELTSGQILTIKFRGEVVRVKILDIYKPD